MEKRTQAGRAQSILNGWPPGIAKATPFADAGHDAQRHGNHRDYQAQNDINGHHCLSLQCLKCGPVLDEYRDNQAGDGCHAASRRPLQRLFPGHSLLHYGWYNYCYTYLTVSPQDKMYPRRYTTNKKREQNNSALSIAQGC